MVRSRTAVATVVAALALGCGPAGCAADKDAPAQPAYRAGDCPDRITAEILAPVACGWVRVPERHADPTGPTIQLFVARVQPPGAPRGEPALWLGYDVGGTPEYGSMATLAPRISREVLILDPRGTGFSIPHLGCPEVAMAAPTIVALPSGDPAGRTALRDAVTVCHARLTSAGTDVAAYGLDELADDVRDVMAALDLETVSLYTGGTSSRLQLAVLRETDPRTVRVAVLDNGPVTATPDESLTSAALPEALAAADRLCGGECRPGDEPSVRLTTAAAALDASPVRTSTGDGVSVLVDGARLRGITAWYLEQHLGGAQLSARIGAVAEGPGTTSIATAEQVLCFGQRPKCDASNFAHGVWWTVRCRDLFPGSAEFAADVCAQWPVGRSSDELRRPVESDVPVLALHAGLNPYVPSSERELPGLGRKTVVVDPTRGADVMVGCVRSWRDRWMDEPTTEPVGLCPAVTPAVTGVRTWSSS